jgi:hypothetical protein
LGDQHPEHDQPPRRLAELLDELGEVETGKAGDEHHDRDCRQHHADDRSERDPAQLADLRRLDAGDTRRLGAQVVEVELSVTHELALAGREGGQLDERQHCRQSFGAERLERAAHGDVFTGEQRRRHEDLGLVGTECCLAGRHRRATKADHAQLVTVDDEMLIIELAVCDACPLQPIEDCPRPLDELGSGGIRRAGAAHSLVGEHPPRPCEHE